MLLPLPKSTRLMTLCIRPCYHLALKKAILFYLHHRPLAPTGAAAQKHVFPMTVDVMYTASKTTRPNTKPQSLEVSFLPHGFISARLHQALLVSVSNFLRFLAPLNNKFDHFLPRRNYSSLTPHLCCLSL